MAASICLKEDRAISRPAQAAVRRLARARTDVLLVGFDLLLVVCGYAAGLLIRFDGAVPATSWHSFREWLPVAVAVHLGCNCLFGLYGQMWRHASVVEARHTASSWAVSTTLLIGLDLLFAQGVPVSVVLVGSLLAVGAAGVARFQSRLFAFQRTAPRSAAVTGIPTVILGAGTAAAALVRDLQASKLHGLVPVVALDDDPAKRGRFLGGIQVAGGLDELAVVVYRYGIERAVLAIPSAGAELVRGVALEAEVLGVPLKVLPPVAALAHDDSPARDVRDVEITDLLGREQVVTDLDGVRRILEGRRVLVTGAGGSIGSEIARQVAGCKPELLVLLDHDETHLHDVAGRLEEASSGAKVVQVLADIREAVVLERAFAVHKPQVVFHAAAHKHVPLLEAHPSEAVLTNVVGTQNLVGVSARHNVERFVSISTDKAVRPTSVMGASKQVAEQLVLQGAPAGSLWCAVRFGNVLGSRGSVIPTFMRQIAAGGPVTVTHPDMTRFFMSIPEAVQLVMQAAALARGNDVFMLDMGTPVAILAMAKRMIRLTGREVGRDIEIHFTGIRPGEKLCEELQAPGEDAQPTGHPSIVRLEPVHHPGLVDRALALADHAGRRDEDATRRLLFPTTHDGRHDRSFLDLRDPRLEQIEPCASPA